MDERCYKFSKRSPDWCDSQFVILDSQFLVKLWACKLSHWDVFLCNNQKSKYVKKVLWCFQKKEVTRMHSSRMCTVHSSSHVYLSMHWAGGCVSQHALGRGLSAQGVSAQDGVYWGGVCPGGVYPGWCLSRGCLPRGCLPRGCLPRGYLPRRVSAQEGVCPGVFPSLHWGRHPSCEQNDRQV